MDGRLNHPTVIRGIWQPGRRGTMRRTDTIATRPCVVPGPNGAIVATRRYCRHSASD